MGADRQPLRRQAVAGTRQCQGKPEQHRQREACQGDAHRLSRMIAGRRPRQRRQRSDRQQQRRQCDGESARGQQGRILQQQSDHQADAAERHRRMDEPGEQAWVGQIGADRHRRQLHQRTAHRLQHEADRHQVGDRQALAGPSRRQRVAREGDEQTGGHAERDGGQQEAQGHAEGRRLLEGEQLFHDVSCRIRMRKVPSSTASVR